MDTQYLWYFGWSGLLAAMLFIPVSKLMWTLSVRRQERKIGRKLDAAEMAGQLRRARFIAFFVIVPFALMFNANVFGSPWSK